ncbi:hypothetical protein CLIB1444_03S03114 [[Candida] jaroonii]|uniref:Uncharacterized protein n=1 Tax=[Candida] jaroonii TaxID=467808 RepID=A0ACA9Y4Z6_9ASCO|nr:hypothetical protein CLIB1444_03S03114 [[Candida] jaroonii]
MNEPFYGKQGDMNLDNDHNRLMDHGVNGIGDEDIINEVKEGAIEDEDNERGRDRTNGDVEDMRLRDDRDDRDNRDDRDDRDDREDKEELFKKKFIRPRTQSFQSVLSTASLKSLPSQLPKRQGSTISNSSKNFQSFIQAPVLSSINQPEIEIGKQLPFEQNHQIPSQPPTDDNEQNGDDMYNEDTIIQQQRLTLNALKKLSLSPLPKIDQDLKRKQSAGSIITPVTAKNDMDDSRKQPYQPAEVDLSSFASLTRQPNRIVKSEEVSPNIPQPQTFQSFDSNLQAGSTYSNGSNNTITNMSGVSDGWKEAAYHQEVQKNQLKIQTNFKNSLLNELNGRRKSPLVNQITPSTTQSIPPNLPSSLPSNPPSEPSMPQSQPQLSNSTNTQISELQSQSTGSLRRFHDQKNGVQQIKNLRSPLYVPAVLRQTDSSSLRSVDSNMSSSSIASTVKSYLPFTSFKSYEHYLRQPPTRKHWIKDETVYQCSEPSCDKEFNFFERRHHCRKCGKIYCKEHTSHFLYINHLAQFTTGGRGTLSRVCDNCIEEYNEFVHNEFQLQSDYFGSAGQIGTPNQMTPGQTSGQSETSTPELQIDYTKNKHVNKKYLEEEQPVGSVPANWSWSSF